MVSMLNSNQGLVADEFIHFKLMAWIFLSSSIACMYVSSFPVVLFAGLLSV